MALLRIVRPLAPIIATVALIGSMASYALAGPMEDADAARDRDDYALAAKILRPLAAAGDPVAEFKLSFMLDIGLGVKMDTDQALDLLRRAVAQDYGPAKDWLAELCQGGRAPAEDCNKVLNYLRVSADAGDATAEQKLGGVYLAGVMGVAKDPLIGASWIEKAANQGIPTAQAQMGLLYSSSLFGLEKDQARSLYWYDKAAAQGNVIAILTLANAHLAGSMGFTKDGAVAANLYRPIAEAGDLSAEMALAKLYEEGDGIPKDPVQSFYWYRKMAEKDYPSAQAKIAAAYALGKGVLQDYVQAYVWFDVAAADGLEGGLESISLARDAVAKHLTSAQLKDAKRLSAALKAKFDTVVMH